MGRPRKSEPRDRQLNLSLTASELHDVTRRAEALGMRPVHFGRAVLLDPHRAPVTIAAATPHPIDRLIHGQLIRLGNNLNQLVRHLHRTQAPVPIDLGPLLTEIRRLIAKVTL